RGYFASTNIVVFIFTRISMHLIWPLDCILVFFFSSRRRHTRWPRDWSSDVCSSDLVAAIDRLSLRRIYADLAEPRDILFEGEVRSEERRVGKECRSRWLRKL